MRIGAFKASEEHRHGEGTASPVLDLYRPMFAD